MAVLVQAGLCLLPLVPQQKPSAFSGQLPRPTRGLELECSVPATAATGHFTFSSSIAEGSLQLCGGLAALAGSMASGLVCV